MRDETIRIDYTVFATASELPEADAELLDKARQAVRLAYAPYSRFRVGAAAFMADGSVCVGSNQENASFPVGLCAEGVLLANASANHPGVAVKSLAVTYEGEGIGNDKPLSPCGVCRQKISEQEQRFKSPIRLILGGLKGEVYVFESAGVLLPLTFKGDELPR
jgi:cytidine deaminase